MPASFIVRTLSRFSDAELEGLCDLLIDVVEGGASVSFMYPMTRAKAQTFWRDVAASAKRGERVVVIAEDETGILGTAQVVWAGAENQPHRADLAKMLVRRSARRRGIGAAVLRAAEAAARAAGKTVLVLDTASDAAERLYERAGWKRVGTIPNYALLPGGEPCATVVFFKELGRGA
jgi:GNAT superfamily N-acetyltransferase